MTEIKFFIIIKTQNLKGGTMYLLVVFELEKDNSKVRPVRLKTMYLNSDPTTFAEHAQFLEAEINELMIKLIDEAGFVTKVKVRQIIPLKG